MSGVATCTSAKAGSAIAAGDLRPDEVGNKFATLATLSRAGLPVPELFCLPAQRYRDAAEPLRERIELALSAVDFDQAQSVSAAAARIKELFAAAPVPDEGTILAEFDRVFGPRTLVAVRACVVGAEDSASDPHAGMSDSFLYVGRDRLVDRIRACWASGFTAESLLYRHVQDMDLTGVAVAVGIQRMAFGERSFVLFTCDPRSGDRETVIAAGWGIGEGVVQEKVGVDHFFVRTDRTGRRQIRALLAHKPERLGPDPADPAGGPVPLPVPADQRDRPVLSDAEVRRLGDIGQRIEDLLGAPQDIEGTFTADGALHLVQARPVAIDLTLRRQWSNANITESFPGVTTALTYSFARRFYRAIFYDLYRRLGVPARTLHRDEPYLERMIGLQHGRVYYQLDAWYRLHGRLAVFPLFRSAWETMMGLEPGADGSRADGPRPSLARLALPLARVARRFLAHDRAMAGFEAAWEAVIRQRRGRDWSAMEPLARIADFHAVWRAAGDLWGVTLINDSVLSTHAGLAQKLLARWLPDGDPALLCDLLCGDEENKSVAIVLSTVRLAEQVRARPGLLADLEAGGIGAGDVGAGDVEAGDVEAGDLERVWARLDAGEYGAELAGAFRLHLHRYGDRSLQELKMEQPNLRHAPWELLALTAQYARSDLTADGLQGRELNIRAAAERRLELALGTRSVRLRVLRWVLGRLRRGVRYRENSRYCRSEWFGVAKEIFASLGADLAARGVLRDPADVVHLTMEELFGWYDGTGVSAALQPLADARRAEFEAPGPELPMRFTTVGTVPASRPAGLPAAEPAIKPVEPGATPGGGELRGLGSSRGMVRGTARVVLDPRQPLPPGAILVARETDPGWLFLMLRAAGIVVERGTMLSHTAITGRKFGIPTIVGLAGASTLIPDGALVEMDGATGRVTILAGP